MRKAYILTFHGSVNYGAVLQAYALNKTIQFLGVDCQVIDYNRKLHHRNFLKINAKTFKSAIYQLMQYPGKFILHRKFDRFTRSRTTLTKNSYNGYDALSRDEFSDDAIYIVGSDQVWNCELTENNFHYFLDFTSSPNKYSYAASFGVSDISSWQYRDKILKLLRDFAKISVREESGQAILEKELNSDSVVVCDPTFLLKNSDWDKAASHVRESGYILTFMLSYSDEIINAAKKLSDKTGLPIINIAYSVKGISGIKDIKNVGPDEWLGYIKNAEYIFTNSFHGFSLSLNYNKQVWVALTAGSRNSRILDLAKRYGVMDRVINNGFNCSPINYDNVNTKIEADRIHSLKFLEEVFNESKNG